MQNISEHLEKMQHLGNETIYGEYSLLVDIIKNLFQKSLPLFIGKPSRLQNLVA